MTVIGQNVKRAAALGGSYDVEMVASSEIAGSKEVRPLRQFKKPCIRQEWRGEAALADGEKRFLALRRKSIQVAAIHGDSTAASGRCITDCQSFDSILLIKAPLRQGQRLHLAASKSLGGTRRCTNSRRVSVHRQRLGILEPNSLRRTALSVEVRADRDGKSGQN